MKHKYKNGTLVVVLNSTHSNVHPGDIGKISSYENLGYGVDFHKWWPAVVSNEKGKVETRTLFFEEKDIKST